MASAVFLSNFFSGSKLLSSFQLAWGYQPSILGIPASRVPQELLDAHIEQTATRALQRAIRSRVQKVPRSSNYKQGDRVSVWVSEGNAINSRGNWVEGHVSSVHEHYIEVRRVVHGQQGTSRAMKPAYEDVRLAPHGALARELLSCSLDDHSTLLADRVDNGTGDGNATSNDPPDNNALLTSLTQRHSTEHNFDLGAYYASSMNGKRIEKSPKNCVDVDTKLITSEMRKANAMHDTSSCYASIERDIGIMDGGISGSPETVKLLQSEKGRVIGELNDQLGTKQVSRSQMQFAPAWILNDALAKEHDSNWGDAYSKIPESEVPENANVVGSHVVYKVKCYEDGHKAIKARIVPHGNEDSEKNSIRKDSANAQLGTIRLLLSLVTFLRFDIWTADIKGAYLQSGPIKREVYVRPPKDYTNMTNTRREVLWKLLKLPYDIVEAGRQWKLALEEWMLTNGGLNRVHGVSQLFVKRNEKGKIVLLVAKLSDDFLMAGISNDLMTFTTTMGKRFIIGRVCKGPRYKFGGCEISLQANSDIRLSMDLYGKRVMPIELTRTRRRMVEHSAAAKEVLQYRSLCGTLLYLGNGILPQAALVVSLMQQRLPRLKVAHLVDANEMVHGLRTLDPTIVFKRVPKAENASLCALSDASHQKDKDYGQTDLLIGILCQCKLQKRSTFHVIDWVSQKQQRVSYSSYGSEILAAATADEFSFYYKQAINTLFPLSPLKLELNVDSKALWDTITTLHEGRVYRLRSTMQRLRNAFEAKEINIMRWLPDTENVSDALTKQNIAMWKKLNEQTSKGYFVISMNKGQTLDTETW